MIPRFELKKDKSLSLKISKKFLFACFIDSLILKYNEDSPSGSLLSNPIYREGKSFLLKSNRTISSLESDRISELRSFHLKFVYAIQFFGVIEGASYLIRILSISGVTTFELNFQIQLSLSSFT